MILEISHQTRYVYASEVSFSPHYIRLRPREDIFTRLPRFEMTVQPDGSIQWVRDFSDCQNARVYFPRPSHELRIDISMTVENISRNPFDMLLESRAATFPFAYTEEEVAVLQPWLRPLAPDREGGLPRWLTGRRPADGAATVGFVFDLNRMIQESFEDLRRDEEGVQSPLETLNRGVGTCRDFAWLMVECCRLLGLAARLVGGYLYVPGDEHIDGVSPDSTLHAWAELYLPGAGWRGIDPTNGVFCDEHYITTATGTTPETTAAVQGHYYHPVRVSSEMHSELNILKRD